MIGASRVALSTAQTQRPFAPCDSTSDVAGSRRSSIIKASALADEFVGTEIFFAKSPMVSTPKLDSIGDRREGMGLRHKSGQD
jgi:hypothetical protein